MDIKIQVGISWLWFFPGVSISISFMRANLLSLGVIVEIEGSIRKMQKRALFHYKKKLKRTPLIWPPPMEPLYIFVFKKKF